MILIVLQALYYFLPAYISNMAPVIFGKLNLFPQQVDFGKKFNGQPIFGSHKTWGGLIYATIFGTLIFSFLIGTAAGTLPAIQASRLQPVEAFRK